MLQEGERVWQRNEGKWEFSLDESENRKDVVLDVAVGESILMTEIITHSYTAQCTCLTFHTVSVASLAT